MKHTIEIEIVPFSVPEGVYIRPPVISKREDGFKPSGAIPFSEVEESTLSAMCDEFRKSVFEKARKVDPYLVGNSPEI